MNSNRKGWGHPWQIAAFPDRTGLTCADTYKALWPLGEWTPELLAAVLNGPVANAYVYTHATGRQLTDAVLKPIPVPRFDRETKSAIEAAVKRFMRGVQARGQTKSLPESDAKSVLLTIDALVLGAYQLPPPLERKLVNLFRGENRPLPFRFPEYVEELLRRRLVEQTRVLEQDTDEQRKTWEALKKSLDKDRHSFRKLFP